MSSSDYRTRNICGGCLHHKDCHALQEGWYRCGCCGNLCEPDEYVTEHKPSNVVIMQNMRIEMATKKPVAAAPKELTGQ